MDNQKNQNIKFEKIKNHLKKNALNADKMQIKIILLFLLVGLHIFLIPNDILDKFPFLASYTDFMVAHIPFVKATAEIKQIPQIATFYASNMAILSLFIFFPLFLYNALLVNIKRFEMFGWYEYNPYNRYISHNRVLYLGGFLIFIFMFNYLYFHSENILNEEKLLNIGDIFILQGLEFNKIKFGLMYKITILLCGAIFSYSLTITYFLNQIITLIQNFNKKFNTKDKK